MIETIKQIIETEKFNLEEAQKTLETLEKKWFKIGKDKLIEFLKIYIKKKEEVIKYLEGIKW